MGGEDAFGKAAGAFFIETQAALAESGGDKRYAAGCEQHRFQIPPEAHLIDCVPGLGPNLFYNSPTEACVVICRTAKPKAHRGKIPVTFRPVRNVTVLTLGAQVITMITTITLLWVRMRKGIIPWS